MGKFELIDVAYSEPDANQTKRQLQSQGLTVNIKKGKSIATQQTVWTIFAKKGKK